MPALSALVLRAPRLYDRPGMCHPVVFAGVIAASAIAFLPAPPPLAAPKLENSADPDGHSAGSPAFPAQAARALAARDHEGAIEACRPLLAEGASTGLGEARARCHLVAAAALLEKDEPERAAALLAHALPELGELRPWAAIRLAEANLRLGRLDAIGPLVEEARRVDPSGPLGRKASEIELFALIRSSEALETRLLERRISERGFDFDPRFRLELVRRWLASGDRKRATYFLLSIWRDHPDREEGEEAARLLRQLREEPSWRDWQSRVAALLRRGMAQRAVEELAEVEHPELLFWRGRALMDAGRNEEAEAVLRRYLEGEPEEPAQARILLGRIAARRGDLDAAVAHLDQAARAGAGAATAEAAFLAAFLHLDFGRFDEAARRFEAYAKSFSSRRDEATWFLGWALYLGGDPGAAERVFSEFLSRAPRSWLAPQTWYWRGRALERLGREADARQAYRQVLSAEAPDLYYAWLAAARLPDPPPLSVPAPLAGPADRRGQAIVDSRLARAEALYAVGLFEEAGMEFDAAVEGSANPAFLRAAGQLALEAGDPHRAFRLSSRLGNLRSAAELAYPLAFRDEVESAAARAGLDPLLLLSIARQESGFARSVRSPRGAVGVMQLLPETAEKIAAHASLQVDPARLEDPATNIALGGAYLAALKKRFGHDCLAIAAYNAGPAAVVGWLRDPLRKDLPLDEFVEFIPWRETRNYVKAVMRNWLVFRALAEKPHPEVVFDLPEPGEGVDF